VIFSLLKKRKTIAKQMTHKSLAPTFIKGNNALKTEAFGANLG
jgi:hypothetical protein